MVTLVTYLPFYRIHEVNEYFMKNIKIITPSKAYVFIDNIYHERQKEIVKKVLPEGINYVLGKWGSRITTWFIMFRELAENCGDSDIMFVDSDNVVTNDLLKYHELMSSYGIGYGILDYETWKEGAEQFLARSLKVDDEKGIFLYKVYNRKNFFRGGSPFFWGPKQVVYFRSFPDTAIINGIQKAFMNVTPWLRNLVSDETLLGLLAWLSKITYVPWAVASHHYHHRSGMPPNKCLVAMGHEQFARGLWKEFQRKEFLLYFLKYKMITMREYIKNF